MTPRIISAWTISTTSVSRGARAMSRMLCGQFWVASHPRSGGLLNSTSDDLERRRDGPDRRHDQRPAGLDPARREGEKQVREQRDDERVGERPRHEQRRPVGDLQPGDERDQPLGDHQHAGAIVRPAQRGERAEGGEPEAHRDEQHREQDPAVAQPVRLGRRPRAAARRAPGRPRTRQPRRRRARAGSIGGWPRTSSRIRPYAPRRAPVVGRALPHRPGIPTTCSSASIGSSWEISLRRSSQCGGMHMCVPSSSAASSIVKPCGVE